MIENRFMKKVSLYIGLAAVFRFHVLYGIFGREG